MADEIKELSGLPRDQQEFVLENLSHDYSPMKSPSIPIYRVCVSI